MPCPSTSLLSVYARLSRQGVRRTPTIRPDDCVIVREGHTTFSHDSSSVHLTMWAGSVDFLPSLQCPRCLDISCW